LLNDTNRAPLACDSDEITMLLKPGNETIASGGVRSLTPNRGKARFWYKKAKELGSAEASKQPGADGTAAPETAIGEIPGNMATAPAGTVPAGTRDTALSERLYREGETEPQPGDVVVVALQVDYINTVACPSHAAVIRLSLHSAGFGRAKAGAIGRHLSPIHSCQR
jgi:hypothetical protein